MNTSAKRLSSRSRRAGRVSAKDRRTLARILARYEGARWSNQRSWIPSTVQSARFDAGSATRLELVRKSRYFEKNNAMLNRMADLFECYTVGSDLQMNPASSDPDWNQRARKWWNDWSELPDLTSRQPLGTLLSLAARTWFVDGEVFVPLTRGPSNTPRIQLVEGHLIETPPELRDLEGTKIIDGVQIDGNGRPTAYWFADEAADRTRTYSPRPADMVVHVFEPSRPGQYRGLPFCYPVINQLHDLDDLKILEMRAAKDSAEKTNVIKTRTGELPDAELMRRAQQVINQDLSGNTVVEQRAEYVRETLGGRSIALFPDEEFDQHENKRPGEATRNYWRLLSEDICAGIGMPYVIVFPDTMQGTVYRGALDMANAWFRARSLVIAYLARRIYEYVMGWTITRERGLVDPPADWKRVIIHPPRAVNVDVGRNSAAMLNELEAGATNYELIYGPLGLDWREQFQRLQEQLEFARSIGLSIGAGARPVAAVEPAPPGPNPDDDPEDLDPTLTRRAGESLEAA